MLFITHFGIEVNRVVGKKRYYPIVEDFDDVKGIELEGPVGTVSLLWLAHENSNVRAHTGEIEMKAWEQLQQKVKEDDRFQEGEYLLKIREKNSLDFFDYFIKCDVYKIKRSDD